MGSGDQEEVSETHPEAHPLQQVGFARGNQVGSGGGRCANSDANSGTSAAAVHPDIPCFHTSVVRVSLPEATCACNPPRSNGPAWAPPIAAKNCPPVGSGGGAP